LIFSLLPTDSVDRHVKMYSVAFPRHPRSSRRRSSRKFGVWRTAITINNLQILFKL